MAAAGLGRLWQAATLLREHRGDGRRRVAAADIDGCEAVVLRGCLDLRREMQPVRGWTDEAWDSALSTGRPPLVDADGR